MFYFRIMNVCELVTFNNRLFLQLNIFVLGMQEIIRKWTVVNRFANWLNLCSDQWGGGSFHLFIIFSTLLATPWTPQVWHNIHWICIADCYNKDRNETWKKIQSSNSNSMYYWLHFNFSQYCGEWPHPSPKPPPLCKDFLDVPLDITNKIVIWYICVYMLWVPWIILAFSSNSTLNLLG